MRKSHAKRGNKSSANAAELYQAGQILSQALNKPGTSAAGPHNVLEPPPLAPGVLPEVDYDAIKAYVRSIAGVYKTYVATRKENDPVDLLRSTSAECSRGQPSEGLLQAMRQVPDIYFDTDFSLAKREVFAQVCGNDSSTSVDDSSHQRTLDQLTAYLDIVESHLLQDIAARSDSFFEAAGALKTLHRAVASSHACVKEAKDKVGVLQRDVFGVAVGVRVAHKRRQNMTAVLDVLKAVEEVQQAHATLDLLVEASDYCSALNVLDSMRSMMSHPMLQNVKCMRSISVAAGYAAATIEAGLLSGFAQLTAIAAADAMVSQLAADARRIIASNSAPSIDAFEYPSIDAADADALLPRTASAGAAASRETGNDAVSAQPSSATAAEDTAAALDGTDADVGGNSVAPPLRDSLLPIVAGLWRVSKLQDALQQHRDASVREVKRVIKDVVNACLPLMMMRVDSSPHAGQGRRHTLTGPAELELRDKLQMIHAPDFFLILRAAYHACTACAAHSRRVGGAIVDAMKAADIPRSHQAAAMKLCSDVCADVIDAAQGHVAKLLGARKPELIRYSIADIQHVVEVCDACAELSEADSRNCSTLRNATLTHCQGFLKSKHAQFVTDLSLVLDSDTWQPTTVPADIQSCVDALVRVPLPKTRTLQNGTVQAEHSTADATSQSADPGVLVGQTGGVEQGGVERVHPQHKALRRVRMAVADDDGEEREDAGAQGWSPSSPVMRAKTAAAVALYNAAAAHGANLSLSPARYFRSHSASEAERSPHETADMQQVSPLAHAQPVDAMLALPEEDPEDQEDDDKDDVSTLDDNADVLDDHAATAEDADDESQNVDDAAQHAADTAQHDDGTVHEPAVTAQHVDNQTQHVSGEPQRSDEAAQHDGTYTDSEAAQQQPNGVQNVAVSDGGTAPPPPSAASSAAVNGGTPSQVNAEVAADSAALVQSPLRSAAVNGDPAAQADGHKTAAVASRATSPSRRAAAEAAAYAAASIVVDGEQYVVSASLQVLLRMLHEYLGMQSTLELLSADIARRATELIKTFNTRACTILLGSGDMRMKALVLRRLAVCCRSCEALMSSHGRVRDNFLRCLLPSRRAIQQSEFDRLRNDLRVHVESLQQRMVDIARKCVHDATSRLPTLACSAAWYGGSDAGATLQPSDEFALLLSKSLEMLQQALGPVLTSIETRNIHSVVVKMYADTVLDTLRTLAPPQNISQRAKQAWRAQLICDAGHVLNRLRSTPVLIDDAAVKASLDKFENFFLSICAPPA